MDAPTPDAPADDATVDPLALIGAAPRHVQKLEKAWETVESRRVEVERPLDPARYTTLTRLCRDEGRRVVVGFGGGALPGLAGNLALAQILEELELQSTVEEIWGTSAGAVVGGGWASGTTAQRILALVRSLDGRGALDVSMARFALDLLLTLWPFRRPAPDGVIKGERFVRTIEAGLRVATFEETAIPFRCIACSDDGRGTRKVFRRGPLLPAIFSSMSLPGIVVPRPGDAKGRCFYDGGLVEKTPLLSPIAEHVRSGSDKRLLLIATYFGMPSREAPLQGFAHRFLDCLHVMETQLWEYQRREARDRDGVDLMLLNPHLPDPNLFAFDLTDRDYLATREFLADILQDARIGQTFGLG